MSLREVRQELAEVVGLATTITTLDHVPVTPSTPSAYVGFPTVPTFDDATADGAVRFTVPVTFVVGLGDVANSQRTLDRVPAEVLDALPEHDASSWKSARLIAVDPAQVTEDGRMTVDLVVQLRAQL